MEPFYATYFCSPAALHVIAKTQDKYALAEQEKKRSEARRKARAMDPISIIIPQYHSPRGTTDNRLSHGVEYRPPTCLFVHRPTSMLCVCSYVADVCLVPATQRLGYQPTTAAIRLSAYQPPISQSALPSTPFTSLATEAPPVPSPLIAASSARATCSMFWELRPLEDQPCAECASAPARGQG